MKQAEKKVTFVRRYLNTIIASVISAFSIGFIAPFWLAVSKLNSIKAGEYPGMPQDQINIQYQQALPTVIFDSIVMFVLISIFAFIPVLFIRFKIHHNVNVYHEFKQFTKR